MAGVELPRTVARIAVPPSLGQAALSQLRKELEATLADKSVRVLLLVGSAESFCSGMDLSEISLQSATETAPPWLFATHEFVQVLQTLLDAEPVTVALVEGPALGGGVGLLAACDLVLATERATFSLPELILGLVPAMILPVLAERLGLHQAKRWAITQTTWQAGEAKTAGLVDQLVPSDRVEATVKRTLKNLGRLHPRGVVALKQFTRRVQGMTVTSAMAEGQALLSGLLSQPVVRSEVVAFRDYGILPGQAEP